MTRGVGGQSPSNLQAFLKGVHYPARKDELVERAEANGAPEEVLAMVRDLAPEEYGGPQDVMKAYGELQ